MDSEKRKINLLPPGVSYTPMQKALLEVKKVILKAKAWDERNPAKAEKKSEV